MVGMLVNWRSEGKTKPWSVTVGKESACNAGDLGSIPGLGRSPGEGKGYPLQYSGLENSTGCIVHGVAKSGTWLSDFHFHFTFLVSVLPSSVVSSKLLVWCPGMWKRVSACVLVSKYRKCPCTSAHKFSSCWGWTPSHMEGRASTATQEAKSQIYSLSPILGTESSGSLSRWGQPDPPAEDDDFGDWDREAGGLLESICGGHKWPTFSGREVGVVKHCLGQSPAEETSCAAESVQPQW